MLFFGSSLFGFVWSQDVEKPLIEAVYRELVDEQEKAETKSINASHSLVLRSTYLNESRDIFVHLPEGYETSEKKYPVLYVLDAEDVFGFAVGAARFLSISRMPEMIVVGIPNTNRERDLWVNLEPDGGYIKFVDFLENELIPYIDKITGPIPIGFFTVFAAGQEPLYGFSLPGRRCSKVTSPPVQASIRLGTILLNRRSRGGPP